MLSICLRGTTMTKILKLKYCFRELLLVLVVLVLTADWAECFDVLSKYDHTEYLKYCSSLVFKEKYEAAANDCWSCNIISAMFDGFKGVIVVLSEKIEPLCRLILTIGGAIWLAMYLLKSLGSFAVQNPGKVLDGMSVFLFKLALVYLIIISGIDNIVDIIVNPLLDIGMDIGRVFSRMANDSFY